MKLYRAIDKVDNTDSFFLVYPDGKVAVMLPCSEEKVKFNARWYADSPAHRFDDAVNPVLVAEWE